MLLPDWNTKPVRAIRYGVALLLLAYLLCLPRRLFDVPYATVVTDRQGELLGARIATDGQWRFPPSDTAPDKFARCLIAFEDRHFYLHNGVNPVSILRAFVQNVRARRIVSGGSTITMQTIRLSRGERRTVGEKLIEIVLATRLECRYSKREILALYAAHAPFGGNVVGVEAATWRYFGHSSAELSWAEAAMLAVLPNAPSMIHLSRNREALLRKRNRLLRELHRQGVIDDADYELALSEALPEEPLPLPALAPHLVADFQQTRPGERIVSTIDKGMQSQVEAVLARWHAEFAQQDIRDMAAIIVDVRTARVLAYCGNARFDERQPGSQVDIIRAPRSTGSILKPLLYCAAMQDGDILPRTLLPDIPINVNGFAPQNFSLQFEGAVPAAEVIARSLNVPSVVLLRRYGVPKFYDFLKRAGLTTLRRPASHYGLSLILGGAEATLWDVTAAYVDMARCLEGQPRIPLALAADEKQRRSTTPYVFTPGGVWLTFQSIKEVNRPEDIDWRTIPSMQTVAWKTGTSYGFRDAWAVGVTPRYAVGVWVGNASGEGRPGIVGARTAGPVLFDFFNLLPAATWFDVPGEGALVEAEVCRQSGCLKGRFCDASDVVPICPNGQRTEPCPYHIRVNLTPDGRFRVYENCMSEASAVPANWFVLPPAWEWYYRQQHPEYRPLPPFMPGCGDDSDRPMQFIYPQDAFARITLPRQLDGTPGVVTFELAHSDPNATVFWHIDGNYTASTRDFHKLSLHLDPGLHTLTVVDDRGHTLSATIRVEAS